MSFIQVFALTVAMGLSTTAGAQAPDEPARLVAEVKDLALQAFEPGVSQDQRRAILCDIVATHADVAYFGDFTVGRLRKQVSDETAAAYYDAVKSLLVRVFEMAFGRLKNGRVTVEPESRPMNGSRAVTVVLDQVENRPDTRVQFLVGPDQTGRLKLRDAGMSGTFLSYQKRDEFKNFLGGVSAAEPDAKLAALTEEIRRDHPPCP